jgi:UrcA family protein
MSSKTTILLFSLAITASSFAMADPVVTVKSEVVRYEDVRLTSPVGIAVLYGRIRGAAERACGPDSADLALKARRRSCVDKALAVAVADVNLPALTTFWETKRNGATAAGKVAPVGGNATVANNAPEQSVTVVSKTR